VRSLLLRPAAEDDLTEVYRYIRRVRAACEKLKTFPEVGRSRDDLRPGVRVLGFERRVVIVYTVLSSGDVEIGRVLYGGRDYETLISDENDL
jgi:toxin ParE1/3/4